MKLECPRQVTSLACLSLLLGLSSAGCALETDEHDASSLEAAKVQSSEQALWGAARQGFARVESGSLNSSYSYNSSGGTILVYPLSTGRYRVDFTGLNGGGGNAHAVAVGGDSHRCKVEVWNDSTTRQRVWVNCHNAAGAPADSNFNVWYSTPGYAADSAFFVSENGASALNVPYAPTPGLRHNPGGATTVTRTGVGRYAVRLSGMADSGGNILLTAYGTDSSHCKVENFMQLGLDENISVSCYSASGHAANSPFSLLFLKGAATQAQYSGAHVLASDATSIAYTPSAPYADGTTSSWCGTPVEHTAGKYSTTVPGRYFVRHTSMWQGAATSHVTAYGAGSSYCKILDQVALGSAQATVQVRTLCFSGTGAHQDSMYLESFSSIAVCSVLN